MSLFLFEPGTRKWILAPAEYSFEARTSTTATTPSSGSIYDYELKNNESDKVSVIVPARIDDNAMKSIKRVSNKVVRILGIRDVARLDFRITPDGKIFFI
jgi:D-alanine-D-alanine ligase